MLEGRRKPSEKEAERVARSLLANGDELFQYTQIKASLRLLRDDETIDKELLKYADAAVSIRFNGLLRDAVPRVEKSERTVGDMLSVTDDYLLKSLKEHRYVVKVNDIELPFEDLKYWSSDGEGYNLSMTDNRNSTILIKEEGGRYLVKCPRCDEQVIKTKIIRSTKKTERIQAIECSRCKTRLIRLSK